MTAHDDRIRTCGELYGNHVNGRWRAEYESPCGRLVSERGHTEDEARERLLDTLRRLR